MLHEPATRSTAVFGLKLKLFIHTLLNSFNTWFTLRKALAWTGTVPVALFAGAYLLLAIFIVVGRANYEFLI